MSIPKFFNIGSSMSSNTKSKGFSIADAMSTITKQTELFNSLDIEEIEKSLSINLCSFSTTVLHVNVPELKDLTSNFVYNFYHYENEKNNEIISYFPENSILKRNPRYVELKFDVESRFKLNEEIKQIVKDMFFGISSDFINNENKIENNSYYGLNLNDKILNEKLSLSILNALESNNLSYKSALNSNNIFNIDTSLVNDINFSGNNNLEIKDEIKLENQKNFSIRAQLNKKYLKSISGVAKDAKNSFSEDWNNIFLNTQNFDQKNFNKSDVIPLQSWYYSENPLSSKKIQLIGFIIKKYKFNQITGNYEFIKDIRIINPASLYRDFEILYGDNYKYDISCIYNLEIRNFIDLKYYSFFIESDFKSTFISCVETKIPDPPQDFFINWDYKNDCPMLTWKFPVEPQMDVKCFQIFKRLKINEPFKIISQQHFNDYSIVMKENVPLNTIKYTDNLFYKDLNFNKDYEAIYALACVDAHGNFSNLSKQIKINFDKFTKKLIVDVISQQNAPKFYPNLYLKEEFLLESINNINSLNELTIYLDADTINVIKKDDLNNNINIATLEGTYKINILDLELNDSLNLKFNIKTE